MGIYGVKCRACFANEKKNDASKEVSENMTKKNFLIEIDGCIETNLTHDEWWDQFITWIESRGEYFGGRTETVSREKSVFTENFKN